MTDHARRAADVSIRGWFRRTVETALPWFDPAAERRTLTRLDQLEAHADASVKTSDRVRDAYEAMDARVRRKRR